MYFNKEAFKLLRTSITLAVTMLPDDPENARRHLILALKHMHKVTHKPEEVPDKHPTRTELRKRLETYVEK